MARRRLDALGTYCPVPLLMTAQVMAELAPGDELEIVGDDPGMRRDLTAWCERSGNRLVELRQEGRVVVCRIEKGTAPSL